MACVIGDGEAETGPLAASWHSNKFLDPASDGAVLPILHLNGYKIANPTVLARIPREELEALLTGYGHRPIFVEGDEPRAVHQAMAAALDQAVGEIREHPGGARGAGGERTRPRWPVIVLRTPKGWTGPKRGRRQARPRGTGDRTRCRWPSWRAGPTTCALLEQWLRSYRPEELFDEAGRLRAGAARAGAPGRAPHGRQPPRQRRACCCKPLRLPDFRALRGGGARRRARSSARRPA